MKNKYVLGIVFSILATTTFLQAQTWSYAKQGTPTWTGAIAKDIYSSGDAIVSVGEIGLIDIAEGEIYAVKTDNSGNLIWENSYDHAGTLEITQSVSPVPSDGGYVISAILADSYRPWFVRIDSIGNPMWTSEAWSDLLPENSASRTYAYQGAGGDIIAVVPNDLEMTVNFYTIDNITGNLISTNTANYTSVMPGAISGNASDITNDAAGKTIMTFAFNCVDSMPAGIARFSTSFTVEMSQGCSGPLFTSYPSQILLSDFGYYVVGTENSGGFFGDHWSPYIAFVGFGGVFSGAASHPGGLYNSTGYAITETSFGDLKMVRNNFSGDGYGENPGDYVDIVTIPAYNLPETSAKTIDYAPYNLIESIQPLNDGYVLGGTFWTIDVPSYFTLIGSDNSENLPDCIFNCVWPGDADNSGLTDMDDLLAIGLGYGSTGPARVDASIDWQAQNAASWIGELPDGTNYKYTDCNGDGVINDDDTTAVSNNYAFTHVVNNLKTDAGDIPLSFATDGTASIGLNTIPIMLGDLANPVDAIYGIRFSVNVEGEDIEPGSIKVTFNDSWLLPADNYLQLTKNNGIDLTCDGGAVRTNNTNASGFGEIGTLSFVVIDNIAGKESSEDIVFNFADIRAITVDGEELSIEGVSSSETSPLDINSDNKLQCFISPNPAADYLYIQSNDVIDNINIYSITGNKLVEQVAQHDRIERLNIENLPCGQYIVEVISGNATQTQKMIVIK